MIKLLLMIAMIFACGALQAETDLSVETEVDIQLEKDYEISGMNSEVEIESQTVTLNAIVDINDLTLKGKIGLWNASTDIMGVSVDTAPGICLGLAVEHKILDLNPDMTLSGIASYMYKDTEINEVNGMDMPLRNDVNVHEWEAGVKLTCDILPIEIDLVPYAAMVVSGSSINIEPIFGQEIDLDADDSIGLRLGLNSKINEDWSANVELALIDEESIVISGRYQF